jgi:hypothetical protein
MASTMEINENGDTFWFGNGKLHRDGGLPAMEKTNGDKAWFVNGECHRETPLGAPKESEDFRIWRRQMETRSGISSRKRFG